MEVKNVRLERKNRDCYRGQPGVGKALASTAASLGINPTIAARTEGPLKETAEEIRKKIQGRSAYR